MEKINGKMIAAIAAVVYFIASFLPWTPFVGLNMWSTSGVLFEVNAFYGILVYVAFIAVVANAVVNYVAPQFAKILGWVAGGAATLTTFLLLIEGISGFGAILALITGIALLVLPFVLKK